MKFTRILTMLLVLTVSVSFTSCDEFLAIFDDPVETPDPVTPPEPDPESESNPEPAYASDLERPLTFKALSDGTISVTFNGGIVLAGDVYYTINYGAEKTIAKNTSGTYEITVKKDYVVEIYSTNKSLGADGGAAVRNVTRAVDSGAKYINIKPSMKTEIYGNVMSLLKGKDNFANATTIEANNAFYGLFAGAEKLVNSTERKLMLPATTLKEGCYQDMFNGCKGIEKAPELPAPALVKDCYKEIFYDCSKLNHVACLATDITASDCTKDWLGKAGTEATGAKVLETLIDMKSNSDDGVPESWTAKKIVLVESVTLGKTELVMVVGEADVTLTVTVMPEDATDKTVTWTSSNPNVATVDATGKVHAVIPGEATITAIAGDKSAICKITVKNMISGSISYETTSVEKNYGDAAFIHPLTNTGDGVVSYESSDTKVAEVDPSTGEVSIKGAGSVTITATVADSETYTYATNTASYTLTVNKAAGSISYTTTSVEKKYGDTAFTNELTIEGDGTVSYESSDTKVAEVDPSTGEVTIKGTGSVTITATVADGTNYTYATKTAQYTLTVNSVTGRENYTINDEQNW